MTDNLSEVNLTGIFLSDLRDNWSSYVDGITFNFEIRVRAPKLPNDRGRNYRTSRANGGLGVKPPYLYNYRCISDAKPSLQEIRLDKDPNSGCDNMGIYDAKSWLHHRDIGFFHLYFKVLYVSKADDCFLPLDALADSVRYVVEAKIEVLDEKMFEDEFGFERMNHRKDHEIIGSSPPKSATVVIRRNYL